MIFTSFSKKTTNTLPITYPNSLPKTSNIQLGSMFNINAQPFCSSCPNRNRRQIQIIENK